MAAKSVNITFYGSDIPSQAVRSVWARWWDAEVLCADPRFKMTNESGSYFDWSVDLTLDEFTVIHESFRASATSRFYAAPDWQEIIQPKVQAIDSAVAGQLGKISKVDVQVNEWESGL